MLTTLTNPILLLGYHNEGLFLSYAIFSVSIHDCSHSETQAHLQHWTSTLSLDINIQSFDRGE